MASIVRKQVKNWALLVGADEISVSDDRFMNT